jgi:hypothetical protein
MALSFLQAKLKSEVHVPALHGFLDGGGKCKTMQEDAAI